MRIRIDTSSIIALLSLIAALGLIGVWIHAYRGGKGTLHLRLLGRPYSLRMQRSTIELFGPASLPPTTPQAGHWVSQLSNNDLRCRIVAGRYQRNRAIRIWAQQPGVNWNEAWKHLITMRRDDLVRPLLEALNDPKRFAIAHEWLTFTRLRTYEVPFKWDGRTLVAGVNGLQFSLQPTFPAVPSKPKTNDDEAMARYQRDLAVLPDFFVQGEALNIDSSQMPRLQAQWQDALAVRAAAVPYALPVIALLVLPGLWARRGLRSAVRNRRGLCPACGYDLRASRERCPECGRRLSGRKTPAGSLGVSSPGRH